MLPMCIKISYRLHKNGKITVNQKKGYFYKITESDGKIVQAGESLPQK